MRQSRVAPSDAVPADLKAIMKYAAWAKSANGEWKFMDKNSRDYAALARKGVRVFKTPPTVCEAQLKAWDTVVADARAQRVFIPIAATLMVIQGVAETVRVYIALRIGVWPPRLHDVEETETVLAKQAEV